MYIVNSKDEINYNPKNEIEDVIRNVHMILRTTKEEQPLMRDCAIDSELIDKNIMVIKNKLLGIILTALRKYEPRALLKNMDLKLKDKDMEIILEIEVML